MAFAEVSSVTYEQLAKLENAFEEAEVETLRLSFPLTQPLYEQRQKTVAEIPNFWALVFEQAPPDVDQYIEPSDSAVLLSSLTSFSCSRFEIENGGKGDPRSIAFKFEFAENDYFENRVLEKKFWFRRSRAGFAGLVSEPVAIKWKAGKDLTEGLLDMVVGVWEQEKKSGVANGTGVPPKAKDFTPEQKALQKKIDGTGLGGASFFAWFGYCGPHISAEESELALKELKARLERNESEKEEEEEEEDDEDEDEDPLALEIFPDGDELAIAMSEDLWPNALKYFTQAQEQDALSDADFEDEDDEGDDEAPELEEVPEEEENDEQPPAKKRKQA